jgi:hypothetical protein
MADSSFYGDTPNFATDYPTQNDGNSNPSGGNNTAPSSFYPNGGNYVPIAVADDVLSEMQAVEAQAAVDAANAATSATNAANSAAGAASAVQSAAGTATPLIDGTAAVGISTKWAHEDHRHPTDTSRADAAATTSALALKAPLASPALTGTPTAPTATAGTSTTQLATTAFTAAAVSAEATLRANADALLAPLASPALTGSPTAPTQTAGDNSTKLATTAFVLANNGVLGGAWTAYTPTITAQSGTITTATATGRYRQSGKTVFLQVDITITTAGTGAGGVIASLPVTAAANVYVGCAYERATSGASGAAVIGNVSATQVYARGATGATFIANGAIVSVGITYEVP